MARLSDYERGDDHTGCRVSPCGECARAKAEYDEEMDRQEARARRVQRADNGSVAEAAHKLVAWMQEARKLRREYKERFKDAHPWKTAPGEEEGYEQMDPICPKRDVDPSDGRSDPAFWCAGCREASKLRTEYLHAVRKRAGAMLRLERLLS